MVVLYVVRPLDERGNDYLDRDAVRRFIRLKEDVLGYSEASLRVPFGSEIKIQAAPFCAVKTEDDANRLLEAVTNAFPGKQFVIERKEFADANDIVWHISG